MDNIDSLQIKSLLEELLEEGIDELPVEIKFSKEDNFNPEKEMKKLMQKYSNCSKCKLAEKRTHIVFGEGKPDTDIVFVGEAPGRDEDLSGRPFVGRAGKLLAEIITKGMQMTREDVYICNVLKCRPPGNRDPEKDEISACIPILKKQIEIISPKLICTLGRFSSFVLLGKGHKLADYRGKIHYYGNIPVVVTYHPSALLRNPNLKRPTWEDIKTVNKILAGTPPEEIEYWL